MKPPIQNHISSLFIHVKDLKRSTEWYNKLLGLPIKPDRINGSPIYDLVMSGETGLILDSNINNPREELRPLFMFHTGNTTEAFTYLKEKRVEILSDIYSDPMVSFFHFRDIDGNVIMVCGPGTDLSNGTGTGKSSNVKNAVETSSPIKNRIPNVIVNVKDLDRAVAWYCNLLQIPEPVGNQTGGTFTLPMLKGANLILDQNRHLQGENDKILFMFDTDDINHSRTYLIDIGAEIFTDVERYLGAVCLTFKDLDGNILMVRQNQS